MKRGLMAFAAAMLLLQCTVGAAVIDDVTSSKTDSSLTITGTLPVAKAGQKVGIVLLQKDCTPEQFEAANDTQKAAMIAEVRQAVTDGQGAYTVTFELSESSGTYYVRVGYGLKNGSRTTGFYYFNLNDIETLVGAINAVTGAAELHGLIEPYLPYLGLDTALYEASEDQEGICRLILNERDLLPGKAFSKIGEFADVFYECSYMQAVTLAQSPETVLSLIADNAARYEKLAVYPTWQKLDETGRLAAAAALLKQTDYTSVADMDEVFASCVILEAVAHVVSHGDIQPILEDNAKLIGYDKQAYAALSPEKQSDVHKAVAGERFGGISQLATAIDDAIRAAGKTGGGGTGSSRPGGGGGGGTIVGALATPTPTPSPDTQLETVGFADMETAAWAKEYVQYFYERKLVDGDGDGNFRPNDQITRAEFVKLLVNCFNLRDDAAQAVFDDVTADDWFFPYVASAVSVGILQGVSDTEFAPHANLTREQMAVILDRTAAYLGMELSDEVQAFADDAEISDYARESVGRMYASGLIQGVGDGRFCPQDSATRAQACTVLYHIVMGGGAEQ